jgi:Putative Actinobacterial Holin-X, holin superfamily III
MSETPQEAQQGVADAARGLSDNTRDLIRHEIAAAQRETLDKVRDALPAIGLLGAAGLFGVLSAAASYRLSVRLLEKSLPPATAALVAAAGYGVAAGAAGTIAVQRLRPSTPLVPEETVRRTVATVTGTAKAAAGTAAKTAKDTANAVTGPAAKKATDTAKATAATAAKKAATTAKAATDTAKAATGTAKASAGATAKKAADTAEKAGTRARAARSRASGRAAAADEPGTPPS